MDRNAMRELSYDELRSLYLSYLEKQNYKPNTVRTAYTDTFYLWRKNSHDTFWEAVESNDQKAQELLLKALQENTTGNAEKLVIGYVSQIRRFRLFLKEDGSGTAKPKVMPNDSKKYSRISTVEQPEPSSEQVEFYLAKWDSLEDYRLQEDALNKLFFKLCPRNKDISDILLKVSTLNDFYSTNIFSVYPVAKHILSLDIDARLKAGDVTLVNDIKKVFINGKERVLYSFASKYCSHHNPLDYPIYDSYVDKVLRYFRNRDCFSSFGDKNLKDYISYKGVLIDFRKYYGLDAYNLKQLDKYLWLLGKEYFPKRYGRKIIMYQKEEL